MQEVVVRTWCDYPGCAEEYKSRVKINQQETARVEFWVNVPSRGRPTKPILIELCEPHRDELKALFSAMKPFDQKEV